MTDTNKISKGKRRSAARLAAIQALYEMELTGHRVDIVLNEFSIRGATAELDGETIPAEPALFADLVRGVNERSEDLDRMLGATLSGGRTVERLEILMRSILRAGAYELVARGDIDPPLTISEYLTVASAFFTGTEPAFVNGVLDKLAQTLRGDDLDGDE